MAIGCGSDDGARPSLHRPAVAAWCPSVVQGVEGEKPRRGSWDAREIVGLDLDEARGVAARHGCEVRPVGGEDVDPRAVVTMDLRFDRINVDVTDGVVVGLNGDASGDVVG